MRHVHTVGVARWGAMAAGLALIVGCSSEVGDPMVEPPQFLISNAILDCGTTDPELGKFKLIKLGAGGTFEVRVNDVLVSTVTLAAGECKIVHTNTDYPVSTGSRVTVTEISGEGTLQSIELTILIATAFDQFGHVTATTTETSYPTGNSATAHIIFAQKGAVATFTNEPGDGNGGEGCTPGFWKQSQHFGWWTAPYTPTTQFSAVFENAFPGKTLLDVLKQGGGGLKALGRHTVAALLNAASPSVDNGLTPQQVIDAFNSVFPGGDYEGLKNRFEGQNEAGCPLDRNGGDGNGGPTL
jgi:hypothetical protein